MSSLSPMTGCCLPAQLPSQMETSRLPSGIALLDQELRGGLPRGTLCEWGVPLGYGGREIILKYIQQATMAAEWVLWVSCHQALQVYPPSWAARGVDLRYIRFAKSRNPLHDFKPIYWEPFFRVIVFDDAHFSSEECAYIARKSREHGQLTLALSNRRLHSRNGNVWARYRFNALRDGDRNFCVEVLKGTMPQQLSFFMEAPEAAALSPLPANNWEMKQRSLA